MSYQYYYSPEFFNCSFLSTHSLSLKFSHSMLFANFDLTFVLHHFQSAHVYSAHINYCSCQFAPAILLLPILPIFIRHTLKIKKKKQQHRFLAFACKCSTAFKTAKTKQHSNQAFLANFQQSNQAFRQTFKQAIIKAIKPFWQIFTATTLYCIL